MEEGGRRATRSESQADEDSTLLALKLEEGASSQRMQAASRSWKGFSPSTSRREHSPADTLILAQGNPFQTSDLQIKE